LVAGERVTKLGRRLADLGRGSLVVDRRELGPRERVAGGEERDVVPGVGEAVGEERDDPLDPAVPHRRDREPDRAQDRDPHACSIMTSPPSSCTSQALSNARTPVRRTFPAHEGMSPGATLSSTWRRLSGTRPRRSWRSRTGAPAAHAWGRAAVGYGIGK